MTAIARVLDKKLRQWPPATAQKVEQVISELIALADTGTPNGKPVRKKSPTGKRAPFFTDTDFFKGKTPPDLAENHDKYLYGNKP